MNAETAWREWCASVPPASQVLNTERGFFAGYAAGAADALTEAADAFQKAADAFQKVWPVYGDDWLRDRAAAMTEADA